MSFPKNVWSQLKNLTADAIIRALVDDGFVLDAKLKTERIYRASDGCRVSIHYHHGSDCYGPGLLKALLAAAGWTVNDLRRLKLVK